MLYQYAHVNSCKQAQLISSVFVHCKFMHVIKEISLSTADSNSKISIRFGATHERDRRTDR